MRPSLRALAVLAVAVFASACEPPPGGASGDGLGVVRAALTNVPSNAPCVRFTTTAGAQTITQSFDVTGSTLTATLDGLPFGQSLSISAAAFGAACSALTPTSLATYLSDVQTTTLAAGQTVALSFTLRPTGHVTASTNFLYITLAPSSTDYGPIVIGQQSAPVVFTITNIGMVPTGTLTTTLVGATGQFTVASNTCTTLAAGASCMISPKFTPTTSGPQATMMQVSSPLGGTVTAVLSGIGWTPAVLALSPPSISFGNIPVGTPGAPGTFTITNNGDQPSGSMGVTLSPLGEFSIVSQGCNGSLPGHQSCQVIVRVTPAALGSRGATLTVNAGPGGTVQGTASAVGIVPLTISPTTWTAASTTHGTAGPTQTFTVQNTSAATSPVLTTSSSSTSFVVKTTTCTGVALALNQTCAVTVQFSPTTTGALGGTLTVTGGSPWVITASMTGTGL
ncbi:MAG TPA: choice-of-anchor D domain-containing protein [Polyangia bacterium]|nr:choice-of-anchor D domain-containing protein [Polyangia bacterium]